MPAAADQAARTTIRLECNGPTGRSVGTSFVFQMDRENRPSVYLLITNRHVVEGFTTAQLTLTSATDLRTATPAEAQMFEVVDLQSLITYHPNPEVDLAAIFLAPITNGKGSTQQPFRVTALTLNDLVDPQTEEQMRYVEDILVVGYPQGIWDSYRNLPIFRSGITASPAMVDYENQSKFLIDCSIYPGSSGSPVFLYNSGTIVNPVNANARLGERLKLLGVVFAVQLFQANGQSREVAVPASAHGVAVGIPNNLGVVVKAREILPLLVEVETRIVD